MFRPPDATTGNLMVQKYSGDYISAEPGVGAGWLLQSATLASGALEHFKDGVLIDSAATTSFATEAARLVLGDEVANAGHQEIDVAAVYIFPGALSDADREAIEAYLIGKYGVDAPTVTITGPADGTVVTAGDDVNFTGTASDVTDGDLSSTISWSSDLDGSLSLTGASVNTTTLSEGTHVITASATDTDTLTGSDSITITVDPPPALTCAAPTVALAPVLCLEADTGVTEASGTVSAWADQSGQGNDLTAAGDPQFLASGTPTAAPAISLDGTGDWLDRTSAISGLPAGAGARTMFLVVDYQAMTRSPVPATATALRMRHSAWWSMAAAGSSQPRAGEVATTRYPPLPAPVLAGLSSRSSWTTSGTGSTSRTVARSIRAPGHGTRT